VQNDLIDILRNKKNKRTNLEGKSLFLLSKDSSLRIFVTKIYDNSLFEYFSNTIVILTTIMLAIDSPLDDPNSLK
jgi:hypothetical protein